MRRPKIRIIVMVAALCAAAPTGDAPMGPIAVLLEVGDHSTLTDGGNRQGPKPAVKGDLVNAGALLVSGGGPLRFLFLPNAKIYEFTGTFPAFPARVYVQADQPNTRYNIRFIAPNPIASARGLKPGEQMPLQFAGLDPGGVERAAGAGLDRTALRLIENKLSAPASEHDPALHLAKAIALERDNQLPRARAEYALLEGQWGKRPWLTQKMSTLAAVEQASDERKQLQSRPPLSYALVVGISEYSRFEGVDYADHDAIYFQNYLASSGAVPPDRIVSLTNKEATQANVSSQFERLITKAAGPNDTVYLFFSGHGMSEKAEGPERGFLLESNSDPQEKNTSAYPIEKLWSLIRTRSHGSRILLFADLCRTATYQHSPNRINSVVGTQFSGFDNEVGVILSGSSEQVSRVDLTEGGHGAFTLALVKGLSGAAAGKQDGSVSFEELFNYVKREIGGKQTPQMLGAVSKDYNLRPPRRSLAQLASLWPMPGLLFAFQGPEGSGGLLDARRNAAADRENEGQQVILQYLRGDETPPDQKAFDMARSRFAEANQLAPAPSLEAKAKFCEGRALLFEDQPDQAIRLLEEAAQLDPAAAYAHNGLGIAYLKKGRYPEAAWSLRDAKVLAPHWIYPRHNLALVYMEAGAYTSAEKEYREAIRLEGQSAALHYGLGLLLQRTNRNKEAGSEYRLALKINPGLAEAYVGWGTVLAADGKSDAALDQYREALRLKPDFPAAVHDQALVYAKIKQYDKAIELWVKNIHDHPEFLESRLSLAAIYVERGNFEAAIAQYKAVPDHENFGAARRGLLEAEADLSASQHQTGAAVNQYRQALRLAVDEDDRGRLKKKLKRVQK